MTMDEIFKTMQDLIAEQFAIDTDEIGMDSSFVDDLGADSVDLVELVMAMEGPEKTRAVLEEYADLAAVGTVADVLRTAGGQREPRQRTRCESVYFL